MAIRPAMLYGTECWAVKHQHVHKMASTCTQNGCRGDEDASLEVWWVRRVQRRSTDTLVRRCDYGTEVQGRSGRGRPRKTLEETLRKDLEYLDLTENMTQNRAQWRSRIHIADPT
ncbi:unnamed protein product [Malus baccata var. baccata]